MRKLNLETNYNNKLDNNVFVHITMAPGETPTERTILEPILVTVMDDPSFSRVVQLYDLVRVPLSGLVNAHTLPSHGLPADDFREWWVRRFPDSKAETPMAVYYFRPVPEPITT